MTFYSVIRSTLTRRQIYYSCNSSFEDLSHVPNPEGPPVSDTGSLTQSNMQEKKQKHFSFLELPAEIRNLVYDRVNINHSLDTRQTDYVFHLKSHVGLKLGFFPPRLAWASKQTRPECLSLLFAKEGSSINIDFTFEGQMNPQTKLWIKGLPAAVNIRRLYVFFATPESHRNCDYYSTPAVCLETDLSGGNAMTVVLKFNDEYGYGFEGEGWMVSSYPEKDSDKDAAKDGGVAGKWWALDEQDILSKQEVNERRRFVGKKLAAALHEEIQRNASPGIGMKELECLRRKMKRLGCLNIPDKL